MESKNIIIGLVVVVIILAGVVGYMIMQPASNNTLNISNNTTTSTPATNNQQTVKKNQTTNESGLISAAKAKSIAQSYMANNKYTHQSAGTPSLKGNVYYVPIVEATDTGQGSKGTVYGYVKVDAKTGEVLGVESENMT